MTKPEQTDLVISVNGSNSDNIADFITSLLGQRRTLEKKYVGGRFIIRDNDLIDLLFRLDQRVNQNKGSLVTLKCDIYFSDGRVIHLLSRDAFVSYADQSIATSVGVDLKMSYLIAFDTIAEKQDIRFQAFSDPSIKDIAKKDRKTNTPSIIEFSIDATNLTWGEDVYRHLDAYVSNYYRKDNFSSVFKFLSDKSTAPLFMMIPFMMTSLYEVWNKTKETPKISQLVENYHSIQNVHTLESLSRKLNIILDDRLDQIEKQASASFFIYPFAGIGLYLIILLISFIYSQFSKSFVVMNRATSDYCDRTQMRNNFMKGAIYFALFIGIIASILATHIDSFVMNLFR